MSERPVHLDRETSSPAEATDATDEPTTETTRSTETGTSSPEDAAAAGGSDRSPPAQGEGAPDSY
jgi:hypothetical protein